MGLSRSLSEARDAAGKLKADVKNLKQTHIRDDYEKLLQRSHSLLSHVEQVSHMQLMQLALVPCPVLVAARKSKR